jgi:GNAT superfamily N-acetyltransferase
MEGAEFLIRNLSNARPLKELLRIERDSIELRGLRPSDLRQLSNLHSLLRNGAKLNFWRLLLFCVAGKKLVLVAATSKAGIIAFEMFYFRRKESSSNILHEAFIGVHPDFRNRGISKWLRAHSSKNFFSSGVLGISTNIYRENSASLESALRVGFTIQNQISTDEKLHLILKRPSLDDDT